MQNKRLALTVKEAAELLGISKNSAYQACLTGELPHIKIGKRVIIPRLALERLLSGEDKESRDAGN